MGVDESGCQSARIETYQTRRHGIIKVGNYHMNFLKGAQVVKDNGY